MEKKKKPSGAFKRKQRQEKEESKQKLTKIDKFFTQPSTSSSSRNIGADCDSDDVIRVEKPTEEDPATTTVQNIAGHDDASELVDDICMGHDIGKEPSTSTISEKVNKAYYDLGNFTDKTLGDKEKRLILDMGPLQPSGPFPKDPNQNNRCFSTSYYVSVSKYGAVNRFWLCYSKILDAAYCQPCWLFASQRNNVWRTGNRDWKHLSERIKEHSFSSGHTEACAVYNLWKRNDTVDREVENEIRKEASFWKMVLTRLFDIILTLAKSSLAFRGHRENLNQEEGYHGNFLSVVELVARYDDILRRVLDMPKGSLFTSKKFFSISHFIFSIYFSKTFLK